MGDGIRTIGALDGVTTGVATCVVVVVVVIVVVSGGCDGFRGSDAVLVIIECVASVEDDVTIGIDDLSVDPTGDFCTVECGTGVDDATVVVVVVGLSSMHGDNNILLSIRGAAVGVGRVGLLVAEAVVIDVDTVDAALLTSITGGGMGEAIGTFAGSVAMTFPVAKMFCCSMNSRCSA